MSWIECVPNISEGRRRNVIDACAAAIRDGGALLLDVSADPDHNRTVYTFVGDAFTTTRSVVALFAAAVALIDLRQHVGVHPRLGAVDVVPFVPLDDTPMSVCIALARAVGADVGLRHAIPIYLYEEAALVASHRRLEHVRGAGFEGLAARLHTPDGAPDFGPRTPHPTAGGSAIGARRILVAFNVNLQTNQLDVAQRIARAVRERDGGLPAVKALGLRLVTQGLVQVSMNLTDVTKTSLQQAFDRVAGHARREGVDVRESEIVGLVPQAAMPLDPTTSIKLRRGDVDRVIEQRLERLRTQRQAPG